MHPRLPLPAPPIKSRKTNNEFGTYIDQYTIEQAVASGTMVQILYEGREAQTRSAGTRLDKLFEEHFSDKAGSLTKPHNVSAGCA